jgi:hypothetical protein
MKSRATGPLRRRHQIKFNRGRRKTLAHLLDRGPVLVRGEHRRPDEHLPPRRERFHTVLGEEPGHVRALRRFRLRRPRRLLLVPVLERELGDVVQGGMHRATGLRERERAHYRRSRCEERDARRGEYVRAEGVRA